MCLDDEDETAAAITPDEVSLKCPFSFRILQYPARGGWRD
jgi:hypothetical protein